MNRLTRNLRNATIAVVLAITSIAAYAADGTFDKTLTTSGKDIVSLNTGSGYIHVTSGSDTQVHIIGHVHANGWRGSSAADADSKVQQIVANPPIAQLGNIIKVGENNNHELYQHISIDYDLTLPKNSTLSANTGSGGIDIHAISGSVNANTGSGDIQTRETGPATLKTGSGSINAGAVRDSANLQTGSGDIHSDITGSGDVVAQTGSGSIRLTGVNKSLDAQTGSGDIEIAGQPAADWKLQSGSGSVRLTIGANASVTLDAQTSSGVVRVAQPIVLQTALNQRHVHGTINGGGSNVRIQTGSGDITISSSQPTHESVSSNIVIPSTNHVQQ